MQGISGDEVHGFLKSLRLGLAGAGLDSLLGNGNMEAEV